MDDYIPRRGDHIYAWRKVRMYQHHGIVVCTEDLLEHMDQEMRPTKIEPFMVIEQNIHGLGIVTLREFRIEHPFNYMHDIGRAHYHTDPMDYYLSRSGTCYLADRLPEDLIVKNAIKIYTNKNQRDIWKTYSLVLRNCEQFAFMCCTNVDRAPGEQVLLACNAVKCVFINSMYNAAKFIFQCIRGLAEQLVIGVSIEMIIKGNALAALAAFTAECLVLSARLFVYYYYVDDREKNLARKFAVSPEDYIQQMIQAGFGSLAAFGMSVAGLFVGSTLFFGSMPPLICSIFFGFIGYLAARWLTGILAVKIKKKLTWQQNDDDEKKSVAFSNPPGDDYDKVEIL